MSDLPTTIAAVLAHDAKAHGGGRVSALDGSDIEQWRARALAAEAESARLHKLFDDAGQGEHNILALLDHYQEEEHREYRARILAEESFRRALVEGLAECERLRADGPTVAMRALFAPNEVAAIRADAAREERARVVAYLRRYVEDEIADAIEHNAHAPGKGGEG